MKRILLSIFVIAFSIHAIAQQSVARQWSDVMLNCIRKDFARPTVQARTIAHASWAMYDAFAIYEGSMEPYLIGHTVGPYTSYFSGVPVPDDVTAAQEEAISFAMYRWLTYRFSTTTPVLPVNNWQTFMSGYINTLMNNLGYDPSITSTDYTDGDPAKLGNFIAQELINYGLMDGTNKANNHANTYYAPVNGNIWADSPGNPECYDPNRWQPLSLQTQIDDQTGLPIPNGSPALTPEWGNAVPFSMTIDQSVVYNRDGNDWRVYLDQGAPPQLDTTIQTGIEDLYKWGYFTNILWHSFHDSEDGVMIDISPNNIGNLQTLPENFADYPEFYEIYNGGPADPGYTVNPATGLPYAPQVVKRGDYTRVLSEYWADGPASETPPGHWVKIFNEVADHPELEKKWMGEGSTLSNLEWDVRGYFALCSGLYDAAIACWSAKGYYDSSRPIMAIRYMCDKGQSTDPQLPSYHPAGMPLIPGYTELVYPGDPLAGDNDENVGKIKLYTWKGPPSAPLTEVAGVGWMLGENWYTFQKASFVTPPFPGYYSGHSTYSRTAAEIMTLITGDEYFPGGMSQFTATAGAYLLAEDGPTENITLQWAKYKDASDQCSLSRIYGGLHPPQDDIPGRKVGMVVGPQAFEKSNNLISASLPYLTALTVSDELLTNGDLNSTFTITASFSQAMNTTVDPMVEQIGDDATENSLVLQSGTWIDNMTYQLAYSLVDANEQLDNVVFSLSGAENMGGQTQNPALTETIAINTINAQGSVSTNDELISDVNIGVSQLTLTITYDLTMDVNIAPTISFGDANTSLVFNGGYWSNGTTYIANFDVIDEDVEMNGVTASIEGAMDTFGLEQDAIEVSSLLDIDTQAPIAEAAFSSNFLTDMDAGETLVISVTYSSAMNTELAPILTTPFENPADAGLIWNEVESDWIDNMTYNYVFEVTDLNVELMDIDFLITGAQDLAGNTQNALPFGDEVSVDTRNPMATAIETGDDMLTDIDVTDNTVGILISFDEIMDTNATPVVVFNNNAAASGLEYLIDDSEWLDNQNFLAIYAFADNEVDIQDWTVIVTSAQDVNGNPMDNQFEVENLFSIDTENPIVIDISANDTDLTQENQGTTNAFSLVINFDQAMDENVLPEISFPSEDPSATLTLSPTSDWLNPYAFEAKFNMDNDVVQLMDIDVMVSGATDINGNELVSFTEMDFFNINTTISVDEDSFLEEFVVYPNPIHGGQNFNVKWNSTQLSNLIIYNSIGEVVFKELSIAGGVQTRSIATSELASGMYMVQLFDGTNTANKNIHIVK